MKKQKNILALILSLLLMFSFTACQNTSDTASSSEESSVVSEAAAEINISAAASLTEALGKISELYKAKHPNITLTFNFGSSGTLQTQIEEGAPADIFISAAQKQMDALAEKDLILTDSRKNILINKVVLIVPASSDKNITSFEDCLTDKVSMIAIGNPDSVPVGQYAKEVFTYMNGWDVISAKANLGADVKEVLSWVATGNAECGVVYSTDAVTSADVKVVAQAPEGSHKEVSYPAALLKSTAVQSAAQDFLDFLSSDEAKQVFTDNGFTTA